MKTLLFTLFFTFIFLASALAYAYVKMPNTVSTNVLGVKITVVKPDATSTINDLKDKVIGTVNAPQDTQDAEITLGSVAPMEKDRLSQPATKKQIAELDAFAN